jgi:anion-transporting  ArsA/GET3 family ATPase
MEEEKEHEVCVCVCVCCMCMCVCVWDLLLSCSPPCGTLLLRVRILTPPQSNPMFKDLASAMPGIDEAMSFAEVLKLVKTLEFSVVIFDTAPTGHTLRLLQFPSLLEKAIDKLGSLKSKFGGILGSMSSMLGDDMPSEGELTANLEKTRELIDMVNREFKDPVGVDVCIWCVDVHMYVWCVCSCACVCVCVCVEEGGG